MSKAFYMILGVALVTLSVAPVASAAHYGPCTHEWFEIVFYAYDGYKQNGFQGMLGNAGSGVGYCIDSAIFHACRLICSNVDVDGWPVLP